jgi:hypothetical protein
MHDNESGQLEQDDFDAQHAHLDPAEVARRVGILMSGGELPEPGTPAPTPPAPAAPVAPVTGVPGAPQRKVSIVRDADGAITEIRLN